MADDTGAPPAAAPDAAAAAAAAAAAPAAWLTGADAEIVGHIQNKGWDKLTPDAAAREIAKAHREAERHIGVPADQILRVPKDASDEAGWNAVFSRLGKPAAATDYDLSAVKFGDGTDLSDDFRDFAQKTAHALNLPKDQGTRLAAEIAKFIDGASSADAANAEAALATEKAELAKDWGNNHEANLFIAKQAAAKLGVTPEAVAALEKQIGYAGVMKMFQKIGTSIGEDKFINSGDPQKGIMTREQAVARKAELMNDDSFRTRYLNGDTAANREMTSLLVLITGDSGGYDR